MDKRFLAILVALFIIFGGIFAISQRSSNKSDGTTLGSQTQSTSHTQGQGQKNVTLVEYGDYQCPVCKAYEPVVEQVRATYAKDIRFQFRNLPLTAVHPNAFAAARGAEAAALQNKFWEMHDLLYQPDKWEQWTKSSSPAALFEGYAKELGLNLEQFKADYASGKVNDAVNADLAEFKKTGQSQATPTFFLNGVHLENDKLTDQNHRPLFEKFKEVLDAEISKQR